MATTDSEASCATAVSSTDGPPILWARTQHVLERSPALPLLLLALAVFVWQASAQGGFPESVSSPGAIALLALLIVGLIALPTPRLSRSRLLAIGLVFGYVAWSYLSILWAGQQALAWQGSNRMLMYGVTFALFALWPIDEHDGAKLAGVYALLAAAIGLYVTIKMGATHGYREFFFQTRLAEPMGYTNADTALWTGAGLVALILSGRRFIPIAMRGLLLGATVLLIGLSVLGQSRGWFFVMPVMLIIVVLLVPGRGRTIAAMAIVAIALAAIIEPLLDAYRHPGPLASARTALLLATATLVLVGVAWAAIDKQLADRQGGPLGAGAQRRIGVVLIVLFVLAGIGGVVGFTVIKGDPITKANDAWNEFREGGSEPRTTGNQVRLGELGGTFRYDYWAVAWHQFLEHPIAGLGVDNFGRQYLREGSSYQTPTYPHSVELRALVETGLIGTLLLGGGIAAACFAAAQRMRRGATAAATTAAACLAAFAYFIMHGSLDWLWEYPALTAPALALLGLAMTIGTAPVEQLPVAAPNRVLRAAIGVAGALLTLLIVASLVFPWLSERELQAGRAIASTDTEAALTKLDRASSLNPLAILPDEIAGVILGEAGRTDEAEAKFEEVLEREPNDPFAFLQLGVLASSQGERERAAPLLARARALNPQDEPTQDFLRRFHAGRRLEPRYVNERIRAYIHRLTGLH
jgi:hypothetical protein